MVKGDGFSPKAQGKEKKSLDMENPIWALIKTLLQKWGFGWFLQMCFALKGLGEGKREGSGIWIGLEKTVLQGFSCVFYTGFCRVLAVLRLGREEREAAL